MALCLLTENWVYPPAELEHTLLEKELPQITLHWEHTLTPMLKMLVAASQECGIITADTILCLSTLKVRDGLWGQISIPMKING